MSKTLLESGLNLRTLQATDLDKLVSDLNYNLEQILKLPGFVGIKGDTGESTSGTSGERGSIWISVVAQNFIDNYENIVSGSQINISFLNSQYISNLPKLLLNLGISKLINSDILILPNLTVVSFDSSTGTFKDSGINFGGSDSLSEEEVRKIVADMTSSISSGNPIFTIKNAHSKNVPDSQGSGLNNISNASSVLDIPLAGTQVGKNLDSYKFIYPTESYTNTSDFLSFVLGSPRSYHNLVQKTLENKTVDYLPGVDDSSALTILQDNYKNGICLGHKDSETFEYFSRIYKTETSLFLSPEYLKDNGYIDFSKSAFNLYTPFKIVLESDLLELKLKKIQHKLLVLDSLSNNVNIGDASSGTLELLSKNIKFLNSFTNSNSTFVSLENNELKNSNYTVSETLSNISTRLVPHTLLTKTINEINEDIQKLANDIQTNIDIINKGFIEREFKDGTTQVDFNKFTKSGIYSIAKPKENINYLHTPNVNINDKTNLYYGDGILTVYGCNNSDGSVYKFLQHFSLKSNNNIKFQREYIRHCTINGEQITFEDWLPLTFEERIKLADDLQFSSTYDSEGKLTLQHSNEYEPSRDDIVRNLPDITNKETSLVITTRTDERGHIIQQETVNVNTDVLRGLENESRSESILPAGSIIMYNGTSVPHGFALCDGSMWDVVTKKIVSPVGIHGGIIFTNTASGRWVVTPNLLGRFVMGFSGSVSQKTFGGSNSVTLSVKNLPSHKHGGGSLKTDTNTHNHEVITDSIRDRYVTAGGDRSYNIPGISFETLTTENDSHRHTISGQTASAGENKSIDITPQYYSVMYIMKLPLTVSTKNLNINTNN